MTTTLTRAAATAALLGALLATAPAATAATRPAPRAAAATPHTRGLLTPVRAAYNGLGSFLNGVSSDLGSGGLLGTAAALHGRVQGEKVLLSRSRSSPGAMRCRA
ncbi:hypothetical protein [Streptacidiphilus sp. MAP5-3]|uniref:hypothetical protein n=1 Tax=unclassified Streptacidiphilus TaxID=2643834 RepID=UPI0035196EE2